MGPVLPLPQSLWYSPERPSIGYALSQWHPKNYLDESTHSSPPWWCFFCFHSFMTTTSLARDTFLSSGDIWGAFLSCAFGVSWLASFTNQQLAASVCQVDGDLFSRLLFRKRLPAKEGSGGSPPAASGNRGPEPCWSSTIWFCVLGWGIDFIFNTFQRIVRKATA